MAMGTDGVKEEQEGQKEVHRHTTAPSLSLEEETPPFNNDVTDDTNDDVTVFDDDDAAVILEELAFNFGISARTTPSSGGSAALLSVLTKSASHRSSSHSPRTLLRTCLTKVLVEASLKAGKNSGHIGRLLSAKRNHIHSLSNDVFILQKKIKELEEQNRVLTRISKRQEAALKKYHNEETQLPHLLEAHKMEIRILQDKLRKATNLNKKDSEKLKNYDGRILKLTDELSRLRILVTKKGLPDREALDRKLAVTLCDLRERETEIGELNRRILIFNKSFQQQIKTETTKHRLTIRKLDSLKDDHQRALQKLTDREKQLVAVQHYRTSRNSRRNLLSASLSSSVNTSTSYDIPGAVSSSGTFTVRRVARKLTARKLTPASLSVSSTSEDKDISGGHPWAAEKSTCVFDKETSCALNTDRTCILDSRGACIFDNEVGSALIDLDIQSRGWTTECKVNSKKHSAEEHPTLERRSSNRLPPLGADFLLEKKCSDSPSQFSSDDISSPDEVGSSENQSGSNDYQTSSVAIQDSVSRKTTTLSSWSDETRVEEFSLSRNCSPPTPTAIQPMTSENNNSTSYDNDSNDDNNGNKADTDEKVESDHSSNKEKWDQPTINLVDGQGEDSPGADGDNGQNVDYCGSNFSDGKQSEDHRVVGNNSNSEQSDFPTNFLCPAEENCNFSLIENYPPKERRKLENEIEPGCLISGTNTEGTTPPPQETEPPRTCDSPIATPLTFKLKNEAHAFNVAATVRKNSVCRNS